MRLKSLLLTLFVLAASCTAQTPSPNGVPSTPANTAEQQKVLIVYLTRTGNTEAVAKMISEEVGGDLVSLELENPYPKDYEATVRQVARENETGFLPPLKTKIDRIERYDVVFLGSPTWGMRLPPPMKSFLSGNDLSRKTVVPFNTNAGYGSGTSFQQVRELCRGCKVLDGFEVKGGIERDGVLFVMEGEKEREVRSKVTAWLKKLNVRVFPRTR